jgi:hypothetical protein
VLSGRYVSFRSPSLFYLLVHSRCRGFLFSLDHTQTHTTFGRTPLDEGSARRRDLYLTTQTLYKRQTSIPPVGFEPTIPTCARPQIHALDRATGWSPGPVWMFWRIEKTLPMLGIYLRFPSHRSSNLINTPALLPSLHACVYRIQFQQ